MAAGSMTSGTAGAGAGTGAGAGAGFGLAAAIDGAQKVVTIAATATVNNFIEPLLMFAGHPTRCFDKTTSSHHRFWSLAESAYRSRPR